MVSKRLTIFAAVAFSFYAFVSLQADAVLQQPADTPEHAMVLHKLREIIIDKIEVHDANPKEALRILSEACVRADPDHRGISFVAHFTPEDSKIRISANLENVSVKEALKHLFPYGVVGTNVCVAYDQIRDEGILARTFYLPNGLFFLGPNGTDKVQMKTYDVKPQLIARGAQFPPGGSAIYQADKEELTVVGQPDLINQVDEILNL